MYYKMYGMIVESDLKIPAKEISYDGMQVNVEIYQDSLEVISSFIQQECEKSKDDIERVRIFRKEQESIINVQEVGLFYISNGNKIEYKPYCNIESTIFQQWIVAITFGHIIIQQNKIALHGAALVTKDGKKAFVISGDSGSGKSTLAHELLKREYQFMSDDVVVLDYQQEIRAVPSFPQRRLCIDIVENEQIDKSKLSYYEDAGKQKYAMNMNDNYFEDEQKITALYVIQKVHSSQEAAINEITGSEKIAYIIENIYQKNVYKSVGMQPKMFQKILRLAKEVQVYQLQRPEGKMTVKSLTDFIDESIKSI